MNSGGGNRNIILTNYQRNFNMLQEHKQMMDQEKLKALNRAYLAPLVKDEYKQ